MAIPETQLETWSHQGSITQSSTTYNAIKATLESADAPYADHDYKVFLQGSYGNDTNIYAESDVDIVIMLDDCFQSDLDELPQEARDAYDTVYPAATYTYSEFKRDVLKVLTEAYDKEVVPGNKAVTLTANGYRRKSDVIVAIQYRRYYKFSGIADQSYDAGICFWNAAGNRIANYPTQHRDNCVTKHQATNKWFKPMARILKNMRNRLIDDGLLEDGIAPSYYLEGLLYNVPNDMFGGSYGDTFVNAINWILKADRTQFVCANAQYYLLRDGSPVTWRASHCDQFLDAVVKLWNEW